MRLIPFLLIFLCSVAWAGDKELQIAQEQANKKGISLSAKDISDLRDKGWRERRQGEIKPLVSSVVRPADYNDEFSRGTVEYNEKWRNYCFHKVTIPDGSIIKNCNFTQRVPGTDAITGKNLTFEGCNLVNVKLKASWTVTNCNVAQIDYSALEEAEVSQ